MKTLTTEEAKTVLEALEYALKYGQSYIAVIGGVLLSEKDTIAAAIRIMEAEDVKGADEIEEMQQVVSDFRKATFEFARGNDPENHTQMMENQRKIFELYQSALSSPAAPSKPDAAAPAALERDAIRTAVLSEREQVAVMCDKMQEQRFASGNIREGSAARTLAKMIRNRK